MPVSISTHTSLTGRDFFVQMKGSDHYEFLLTRPSRDVTVVCFIIQITVYISTHTSLTGRDDSVRKASAIEIAFLLTRPSRDVTITLLITR